MNMLDSVSKMIADGKDGDEIIALLFDGIEYQMFDEFDVEYKCNCGREKYLRALVSLSDKDMEELKAEDKPVETACLFCGKKYTFELSEIEEYAPQDRRVHLTPSGYS